MGHRCGSDLLCYDSGPIDAEFSCNLSCLSILNQQNAEQPPLWTCLGERTWARRSQFGSSLCLSQAGAQYAIRMIACTISTDLTEAAIDHLIFSSATVSRAENSKRSRARSETAQPSSQMTAKRVNDMEYTYSTECRLGSMRPDKGCRRV